MAENEKKVIGIEKDNSHTKKKKVVYLTPNSIKPRKKKEKVKKPKNGKALNGVLSILMIVGIVIMSSILLFCAFIVISAPEFDTDKLYSKEATILYDKNGNEITKIGAEQRILVTYEDLPQTLIDAIVATEDARFFQHNGFDVVRFVKASFGQLAGQDGAGGASTLTMQVAKNTFSRGDDGTIESHGIKGIVRKFTDIYMSIFMIERNYTKEEIMEFYVNAPYLGTNTYGVEQASQTYFGKSVKDLTLAESSLLAGIFNAPSSYNPFYSTELATNRRATVLNLMVRHGYITEEQAQDAKDIKVESLTTEKGSSSLNKYQAFIDVVVDEVQDKTGFSPYTTPMLIYTTMDPDVQDVMIALNDGSLGYKWKNDWLQFGCAITDVKDGSITAVNGGRNQTVERAKSRATLREFQPGSTAKPIFAYGPYIEYNNGNTGTIFFDQKMTYSNGQELTNADNSYRGAMTMRQALAQSRNIPAIQAFQALDKDKAAEFIHNLGIDYCHGDDCNLYESYAIGGGLEVSPMDMAAAYGAFARNGYYIEPYSFTKVIFQETDEEFEYKPERNQAMSEETAYMITDMLITATKQGVGGNINVSGTDVASKTGTSTYDASALKKYHIPDSASADNWVITYSPDYVISFWYGVDKDNLAKDRYTDAINAAIERKKISALVANKVYKKNSKFSKPSGVISAKYEKETNPAELPSPYTPGDLVSTELFKKGTEPSEVSNRFSQLENPTNGSAEVSGSQVNLSWNEIRTPDAINPSYLKSYFLDNYGKQFGQTYLDRRLAYNSESMGTIGYQVYLKTAAGLQSLAFTDKSYYVYQAPAGGSYNFVVKSAYSIFKDNMSSGIDISANINIATPVTPEGENDTDDTSKKTNGTTTPNSNSTNKTPSNNDKTTTGGNTNSGLN